MDFGIIDGVEPARSEGRRSDSFEAFEPARYAMGDTAGYAERMGLLDDGAARGPRLDAATRWRTQGVEYLVLQPDAAAWPSPLTLEPGTYDAEWFGVDNRQQLVGGGRIRGRRSTS